MAKKKSEIETETYCDHCEHQGDTKVCNKCITVINEEIQAYLEPTKYKYAKTTTEKKVVNCGDCKYGILSPLDKRCKDCMDAYAKTSQAINFVPRQEAIDEAFKKKHDIAHPSNYESSASVDNVNHPSHYADSTSIECIESMEITFGTELVYHFAVGNAYKYLWRHKNKGRVEEDLNKANWYYHKARNLLESERGKWNISIFQYEENQLSTLKFYIDDYARRAGIQLKEVHFSGEAV